MLPRPVTTNSPPPFPRLRYLVNPHLSLLHLPRSFLSRSLSLRLVDDSIRFRFDFARTFNISSISLRTCPIHTPLQDLYYLSGAQERRRTNFFSTLVAFPLPSCAFLLAFRVSPFPVFLFTSAGVSVSLSNLCISVDSTFDSNPSFFNAVLLFPLFLKSFFLLQPPRLN